MTRRMRTAVEMGANGLLWTWLGRGSVARLAQAPGLRNSTWFQERAKTYLKLGYWPNLARPSTLAEKLLWLKLHYSHPLHARLTDKLSVRSYIEEHAPEIRLPRLLWSGDDPTALPWAAVPRPSVLKPNHASGYVAFLKRDTDDAHVLAMATRWLQVSYEDTGAGTHYAGIPPRLLVEEFLGTVAADGSLVPPADFKVLVANGRALCVQHFTGRFDGVVRRMYDTQWNLLPITRHGGDGKLPEELIDDVPRPSCLASLVSAAERLAAPFPFVRVDFYVVNDAPYFSEMTFVPSDGRIPIMPRSWDRKLGAQLALPART